MLSNEIVKNSKKITCVNDVINNIDIIVDIIKEDVWKIAMYKKIYFADFDFTYSTAISILKKQLMKTHLKAIKRFFQFNTIEEALKWLVSRILNNSINIITNKKYKLFCCPNIMEWNENIEFENNYNTTIEILDLEKIDMKTIITGLKKVWIEVKYDHDFDYEDFEELCCKFGYTANEVVGSHAFEEPKLSKYKVENGQFQLQLLF